MIKRRKALIISMFAVIGIAIIGIGFALQTAEVQNESNTNVPSYLIITPQGVNAYSGGFSNTIALNTVNDNGTITFTVCDEQISQITVAGVQKNTVLLGEMLFNIEQTNMEKDYTFLMNDTSGTMVGTFYVGLCTSEDNASYSSWEYTTYSSGTGINSSVGSTTEWVKVALYIDATFQEDGGPLATSPLDDVIFTFTASTD